MNKWNWKKLQDAACPVCRNKELASRAPGRKFSRRVDGLFLIRCSSCLTLYVTPRPSDDDLAHYYSSDREGQMGPGYISRLESTISAGNYKSLNAIPPPSKRGSTLLDVGCAAGYAMLCAQQRGWQVTGVELSEDLATVARKRYGLEVISGSVEQIAKELRSASRSFDCITMFDVIEHVDDVVEFISFYAKYLSPEGMIHLDTPNYPSWIKRGSDYSILLSWHFEDILEHLSYMSIDSIRFLAKEMQLKLLNWGTYGRRWREPPTETDFRRGLRCTLERIPGFSEIYWRMKRAAISAPPQLYSQSEEGTNLYATLGSFTHNGTYLKRTQ